MRLSMAKKPLGEFVSEIVGMDMAATKEAFAKYLICKYPLSSVI